MINVIEKVSKFMMSERKSWAPACNYASSVGHPCPRKLVYDRLNWEEKLLPDPVKILIFREGNMHEEAIMRLLADSGITVVEQQRPFEWKQLQVRGKIDGRIKDSGRLIPLEVKSSNQFDFESIKTVDDLRNSSKFWVRGYYDQFQLYLFMANEPDGIMILKNKQTGLLKQLVIEIDYEHAEKIAKKLELVNKHIAEKTYPDRITDRTVCQYCDFRHICLPDEASDSIEILDNPEILELLEQREKLKEAVKDYEAIDQKLKIYWEPLEDGTHLVGGRFQVKVSTYERRFDNVPEEIKAQYRETKPMTRVTVTALK